MGTLLNSGDQLQASQGVKAAVSCAGSPPLRVPPTQIYPVSYFCGNSNRTPLRQPEQIDSFPGGNDSTIPYLITPRRGGLLDDTPTLRWNPISGVTRYTVRVVGSGVNWETEISGSEVVYSGEQVLQPGKVYSVIVEADNGTSSQWDEGATDSGFKLVYPDVAERVRTKINDIAQSELSPEAQALAMADLYFEEDLVSEAIATLEPFVKAGSTTVQVYQMLGDLYRYSGLNLLAKERYEEAIA
ncbi:MAG TPA: hypothetical protein DCL61_06480, partial [Cyanobacteria bacterium UBA12227]|nr:hypothetical protein [Cyanobacteria bacterium UBA12227]